MKNKIKENHNYKGLNKIGEDVFDVYLHVAPITIFV